MKKLLASWVWNLSEFFGISLGRFAPVVFGAMIDCKSKKITEEDLK